MSLFQPRRGCQISQGCGVRGLTWDRPITAQRRLTGTITLLGIEVRSRTGRLTPLNLHPHQTGSWSAAEPQGQATDHVTTSRTSITDRFSNINGGYGGISYAQPARIPAVATRAALTAAGSNQLQRPDVVDALTSVLAAVIAARTLLAASPPVRLRESEA